MVGKEQRQVNASPGPAIVTEVLEKQIDLLLVGMGYRTKFGHFEIGQTIPYDNVVELNGTWEAKNTITRGTYATA